MPLSLVTGSVSEGDVSAMPDRRAVLARTLDLSMSPDEIAVQALDGVAFANIDAARTALRNVAAAIEFALTGKIGVEMHLVAGDGE